MSFEQLLQKMNWKEFQKMSKIVYVKVVGTFVASVYLYELKSKNQLEIKI